MSKKARRKTAARKTAGSLMTHLFTGASARRVAGGIGSLRSLLPSPRDYRGIQNTWRADLLAGLTVGIVALPLALAFGVSSGVGAEAGIITAIVAGIIAAIFGGSNVQVSGPTGAMVVVFAPVVASHGTGAVIIVTLMAGVIVLAAGILRFGRAISYIPWPVIEGFTAGIGIIIFLQQVPAAVGAKPLNHAEGALVTAWIAVRETSWPGAFLPLSAVVAVAAIILLLGRFTPKLPGSFIAIVVVSLGYWIAGLVDDENTGATGSKTLLQSIEDLPHSLPLPVMPQINPAITVELLGPALAIAALAAIESLLSARVAASISNTGQVNADRELVGQGLASVASGLFGGMPATGAIARTAVNVRGGARTRLAAMIHSIVLLLIVLVAADVVSGIPLAALAGVLMVTSLRMVSLDTVKRLSRSGRSGAGIFFMTLFVTVAFDLIVAVGLGLLAAAFFALRTLSRMSGAHRDELPGQCQPGDDNIGLFHFEGSLFFGAADRLVDEILGEENLHVAILRLARLQLVDATGAHALAEMVRLLEKRGVTVLITGIRPEHRIMLAKLGVIDSLRHPSHLVRNLDEALEHARTHIRREKTGGQNEFSG